MLPLALPSKRKTLDHLLIIKGLFSVLVPLTVLFSNQFLEDLDLIYELKEWIPKP